MLLGYMTLGDNGKLYVSLYLRLEVLIRYVLSDILKYFPLSDIISITICAQLKPETTKMEIRRLCFVYVVAM